MVPFTKVSEAKLIRKKMGLFGCGICGCGARGGAVG